MSTHEALVLKINEILPHPDPETIRLGIVKVWDYQVVVAKDSWKVGDLAVYVEPDNLVDGNRPEFSFLNGDKPAKQHRIKARRLRGCWSEGLLVPAPEGFMEGQDAWTALGIERYIPQIGGKRGRGVPANLDSEHGMGGDWEEAPIKLPFAKFDVENFKKYNSSLIESEEIVITEKIHGSNGKFLFSSEECRMYAGSRSGWKKNRSEPVTVETPDGPITYQPKDNIWWQAIYQNPWIESFCTQNPDMVVFGEVFGQVQDLKYGAAKSQLFFRIFDIWSPIEKNFLGFTKVSEMIGSFSKVFDIKEDIYAPILYVGPYSKEKVLELTDGKSLIVGADHIREGVVVKPTTERYDMRVGRIILKNVSNNYLERA